MAYDKNNSPLLRRDIVGYVGNASTRADSIKFAYAYATTDAPATVEAANYFDAEIQLSRGDQIQATMNAGVGQTPVFKNYVVVTGIASGDAHNTIALASGVAG